MADKKEMKSDRTGTPAARGRDEDRTPEVKGIASALKPEELTTSVAAQDISLWLERWEEYKNNSSFCKLGKKSILAYLKHASVGTYWLPSTTRRWSLRRRC